MAAINFGTTLISALYVDSAARVWYADEATGGIGYYEATNLLTGIASRGKIVGFDVVEIAPVKDNQNLTSLLTVRLTLNLLGAMARNGQFNSCRRD